MDDNRPKPTQVSLRSLLLATLLVSIALAVARTLGPIVIGLAVIMMPISVFFSSYVLRTIKGNETLNAWEITTVVVISGVSVLIVLLGLAIMASVSMP